MNFVYYISEANKPALAQMKEESQALISGSRQFAPSNWKGYKFIPGFEAETAKHLFEEYDFQDNAVVVVSYPKTGTNWSAEILRLMLYGHDEKLAALTKSIPMPLQMLEMGTHGKLKVLDEIPIMRRLLLTHLPEELFNFEKAKKKNMKIIIILRNPKDQAVSWYHFTQSPCMEVARDVCCKDWPQFLENYMSGKQPTISKEGEWYPDHILGWYKHKDDPNVLFVHFEDLKRDVKQEIRRMAKFLDIDLSEERVQNIAELTTFSKMKKQAEAKGSEADKLRKKVNMMRKGQVGEWKGTFTVTQSEFMDDLIEEKLGKTDIKFTYEL